MRKLIVKRQTQWAVSKYFEIDAVLALPSSNQIPMDIVFEIYRQTLLLSLRKVREQPGALPVPVSKVERVAGAKGFGIESRQVW